MFDYLAKGYPLDYFVEQFPSVDRDHVVAVLREASDRAISEAKAA